MTISPLLKRWTSALAGQLAGYLAGRTPPAWRQSRSHRGLGWRGTTLVDRNVETGGPPAGGSRGSHPDPGLLP
jgi:hypothetical protein